MHIPAIWSRKKRNSALAIPGRGWHLRPRFPLSLPLHFEVSTQRFFHGETLMTHPPDVKWLKMVEQLDAKGLKHYVDPLFVLNCVSDLLGDYGAGEWDEQRVLNALCAALNEPLEEHIKDYLRPWAKRQRPDLERFREYSRSWRETYCQEHHGLVARTTEGLSRRGIPSKRFFMDGRRVSEEMFFTLTCDQRECPRHQTAMRLFKGEPVVRKEAPLFVRSLVEEKTFEYQGRQILARRARLTKVFHCNGHAPVRGAVDAWDLYGDEGFLCTVESLDPVRISEAISQHDSSQADVKDAQTSTH